MNTTIIAQVLGVFFSIIGISMVVNSKATDAAIAASVENKGILWLWGILALVIGAVVVVSNNVWTSGLPLLVTLIGWIAIIKGAFILIAPAAAASLYRKFNKAGILVVGGVVAFALGVVLLFW